MPHQFSLESIDPIKVCPPAAELPVEQLPGAAAWAYESAGRCSVLAAAAAALVEAEPAARLIEHLLVFGAGPLCAATVASHAEAGLLQRTPTSTGVWTQHCACSAAALRLLMCNMQWRCAMTMRNASGCTASSRLVATAVCVREAGAVRSARRAGAALRLPAGPRAGAARPDPHPLRFPRRLPPDCAGAASQHAAHPGRRTAAANPIHAPPGLIAHRPAARPPLEFQHCREEGQPAVAEQCAQLDVVIANCVAVLRPVAWVHTGVRVRVRVRVGIGVDGGAIGPCDVTTTLVHAISGLCLRISPLPLALRAIDVVAVRSEMLSAQLGHSWQHVSFQQPRRGWKGENLREDRIHRRQ